MAKDRFKIVPTSHLILIKDGKILLARRFNTGWGDGLYSVVAGHVEEGETFTECIVREAKEESGLEIDPKNLNFVHMIHRKSDDVRVDVFMSASKWTGKPIIMEPEKCDDIGWFDLDNLPENMVPYVRQAIEKVRNNIYYSEHGW